jgi:hypothetical protein
MLSAVRRLAIFGPKGPGAGNSHAYRYYRVLVNATQVASNVAGFTELEIAASIGGADTTAGRTYTASTEFPGAEVTRLFDDNLTTEWGSSVTTMPQWAKVDYGVTAGNWIAANQIKITVRPSAGGGLDQAPKDFIFQGSDDNTNWTDLITRTGVVWASGETKTFTVP